MDTIEFHDNTYYGLRSREDWLSMMEKRGLRGSGAIGGFDEPKEYPCLARCWDNGGDNYWAESEYLYRKDVEEMIATLQYLL